MNLSKEKKNEKMDRALELVQSSTLTKYKIAQDTGISETSIGNYKNGKKRPSFANAVILIRYFEGDMLNASEQINIPPKDLDIEDKPQMLDRISIPYEFVQSIIKSNDALLEEKKRYDMERRELLSQQAKLIDMLDNRLSALEKSNASTVSSVPTSNTATAGESEK